MNVSCPFCTVHVNRVVLSNDFAFSIRDAFPISPGHTLIIPRRHVASFFDATSDERIAMLQLLDSAKLGLDEELHPDGYNVGINDGQAAGQTVLHLHIHLIPRFTGDRGDPRGGIRWLIPEKADYWSKR